MNKKEASIPRKLQATVSALLCCSQLACPEPSSQEKSTGLAAQALSTQKICTQGATLMPPVNISADINKDGTPEFSTIYKTSFKSSYLACWQNSPNSCDPENPQTAIWTVANSILITSPGTSKQQLLDELIQELLVEFPELQAFPLATLKSQFSVEQLGLKEVYELNVREGSLLYDRLGSSGLLLRAIPILQASLDNATVQPNFIYFGTQSSGKFPNEWDDVQHQALLTINAPMAWEKETGSRTVRVAVIDSAIDCDHSDLKNNIAKDPRTRQPNGWAFSGSPCGKVVHGSFCAGIIGAEGNNGLTEKAIGVNWEISIIPIRFLDDQLCGSEADAVNAVTFAADKADVLSASWGGLQGGDALKQAILKAPLFIAAAGNLDLNLNDSAYYPASYSQGNMIVTGGIDLQGKLYGNHGTNSVHLSAPAQSVKSTGVGIGSYETLGGTSAATAFVAGACALLKAYDSSLTASDIRKRIITTARPSGNLGSASCTAGILDLQRALDNNCSGYGGTCTDYPARCP